MKLFEKCLIACDIDNTLMVKGIIPEANKEKIRFFIENGGVFALATGRSVCAVSDIWRELKELSLGIYANGTVIYDNKNDKLLFDKTLPKSEHAIMYRIKERFPKVGIELHYQNNVGIFNETEETRLHAKYESMKTVLLQKSETENLRINKILYAPNSPEEARKIKPYTEKFTQNSEFVNTTVTYYGKQRLFIEQIPKNLSKAVGVKKLAEILNIAKGNIFAIGDYYNDLEMLRAADISAVPIESPEQLKQNADYITKSAENGAVADFIDYLTMLRRI